MEELKNIKRIGLNIFAVSAAGFIISGCAPTYSISPDYNKESKTVMIDDLKFENVTYYTKKVQTTNDRSRGNIFKYRETFKIKNNACDGLYVKRSEAVNGWYFSNSVIEDMKKRHNDNCTVEKIANINFSVCTSKKTVTTDKGKEFTRDAYYYNASTSVRNQSGYGSKTLIELDTKQCFNQVKEHFKSNLALNSN